MHTPRSSRRRARQLLDNQSRGDDPVGRLLDAASAPARAEELAGETQALLAFRATVAVGALPTPPSRPRRTSMIKTSLAQLLAAKTAAAVLGGTAVGGIALAASTGVLPGPIHPGSDRVEITTAAGGSASATGRGSDLAADERAKGDKGEDASPSVPKGAKGAKGERNDATVPASLLGLCKAWTVRSSNPSLDKISGDPSDINSRAFRTLVTAAGGADKVSSFCKTTLATAPGGTEPGGSAPGGAPGQAPDASKGGKGGDKAGGKISGSVGGDVGDGTTASPGHVQGRPSGGGSSGSAGTGSTGSGGASSGSVGSGVITMPAPAPAPAPAPVPAPAPDHGQVRPGAVGSPDTAVNG